LRKKRDFFAENFDHNIDPSFTAFPKSSDESAFFGVALLSMKRMALSSVSRPLLTTLSPT
jgi:hypothetical protein